MTECRVMIALGLLCLTVSWSIQLVPKVTQQIEETTYRIHRDKVQLQIDRAFAHDANESELATAFSSIKMEVANRN